MSDVGLRAARSFGSKLPAFRDIAEAEGALYGERDELVRLLAELSRGSAAFRTDFSPESLKDLEHWYFELLEVGGLHSIHTDDETFERAMAMYLGEVLVRHAPPFEWFVTEFAFERGRYEIGVRRPLYRVMLSRLSPAPRERNRRERSIWRTYQKHRGHGVERWATYPPDSSPPSVPSGTLSQPGPQGDDEPATGSLPPSRCHGDRRLRLRRIDD